MSKAKFKFTLFQLKGKFWQTFKLKLFEQGFISFVRDFFIAVIFFSSLAFPSALTLGT